MVKLVAFFSRADRCSKTRQWAGHIYYGSSAVAAKEAVPFKV